MKNIFFWAFISLGMLGTLLIGEFGCKNKPTPAPPVTPTLVVVPDSQFCKSIAPLPASQQKRAVGVRGKYWAVGQNIRVKFMGGTSAQRQFVKDGFSDWTNLVNLKVSYVTTASDIRVAFNSGDGSWSYIGTDAMGIPASQPTMNIGWSGIDVCLHEIGHAIGMAHEQANPNKGICWNEVRVIKDLSGPPNNWDEATIRSNVFYKYAATDVNATPFDPGSIMQYSVPSVWTCDGNGIPGGKSISSVDAALMASIYPYAVPPPVATKVSLPTWQRDSIVKWLAVAK
jgi:hypothetical protein